ncbi:MAG: serine hydroxymethyltransferase [Tenericutes bacterium]|nr:serine hydroxymethyltransferase [Mycoplasmatota bacterium]
MNEELKKYLELEKERQQNNIELIASENYTSKAVMELQGSILTNKYAEGYPGKRYYGGCEYVDFFEEKAIEYASKLFGAKYVNVQPHSGSSANLAVYRALLNIGDTVLGMNLSQGGHLTHGSKVNFSGKDYNIVSYGLNEITEKLDYDEIERLALLHKPKMIIAGSSAYSGLIDFEKFRTIADKVGAYLMVDMAHIAGLVAAGLHMNPVGYADVVTSTTHKTLRGPRGGIILTNNEDIIKKVNKTIFPGIQGGPLMHVIAAKAQCFSEALDPSFKEYALNVLKNAKRMALEFKENNVRVVSGETENHLMLIDVKESFGLTGVEAETILDRVNITVNKNMLPFDKEKPTKTSGLRLGSPAMTTRGLNEEDFALIANIITDVLRGNVEEKEAKEKVLELTKKYPI